VLIPIEYFIAVCVLMIVQMIVESFFYRKVVEERDTFAAFLELYIKKYGKQTFDIDGIDYKVE